MEKKLNWRTGKEKRHGYLYTHDGRYTLHNIALYKHSETNS